ncbi:MAG: GNAT family N-acetyltransferase [Flavobacteriales bacterium]|nr:GNAT family N-acetyltransferase [Flavobacteriales bacterium]
MKGINIIRIKDSDAEAEAMFHIRRKVFVEEQLVSETEEFDEFEETSNHYILYLNENPVACARWREVDDKIKLERFAVLKEHRKQGLGGLVLERILQDILSIGKPIYMHAQIHAIPFYKKFNFIKKGELFTECGIEHFTMYYHGTDKD